MRLGLDTCFLVAHEVKDHPRYADSRALFRQCVSNGDDFALAPQVLAEGDFSQEGIPCAKL